MMDGNKTSIVHIRGENVQLSDNNVITSIALCQEMDDIYEFTKK